VVDELNDPIAIGWKRLTYFSDFLSATMHDPYTCRRALNRAGFKGDRGPRLPTDRGPSTKPFIFYFSLMTYLRNYDVVLMHACVRHASARLYPVSSTSSLLL